MLRPLLVRLGAVALGLLLALALLEIGLRIFAPEAVSLVVKDELLGRRYRRSFEQQRYIPESDREVLLRFNRLGFRGSDLPEVKPPGTLRIALHGDSQVAAAPVSEEKTLAVRLEGLLSAGTRETWQVMNFGVSAYGSAQSYLAWQHVSRRFDPDLVVLVFLVSNDVGDNAKEVSLDAAGGSPLDGSEGGFDVHRWLTRHTLIYPWHKVVLRRARLALRRRTGTISPDLYSMSTRPPATIERGWKSSFEILERFHREVVASGASFLLVISPDPGQFDDAVWSEMLDPLPEEEAHFFDRDYAQRRLNAFAEDRGIPALDLLPAFRERRPEGPLSFGRGHWNARGNELAAREIYEYLRQAAWTRRSTRSMTPAGRRTR